MIAKGKLSPHQEAFIDEVVGNEGVACVVRSVDELAEDLKEVLHSVEG